MPEIEASIWRKYQDQGVVVYGIYDSENPQLLDDFVEQTGITYPIVKDEGTRILFDFPGGVGYPYPRDVVIGKDLRVRSIRNSFNVGEMDALIQQLLSE